MFRQILSSIKYSFVFVLLLVGVYIVNLITIVDLSELYGLIPRNTTGLDGIFFSPFLHTSSSHLISNSIVLFVALVFLDLFYKRLRYRVLLFSVIFTGILVWFFGRNAIHIGASGVIYSILGFLILSGLLRGKIILILVSVILLFYYGDVMYFGLISNSPNVSYESHFLGLIVGIFLAYLYRKEKLKIEDEKKQEYDDDTTNIST